MNIRYIKIMVSLMAGLFIFAGPSYAGKKKKYHCEKDENGKVTDLMKVKSRKKCKVKGGKWVKEHKHDHDHDHGDDHEHVH